MLEILGLITLVVGIVLGYLLVGVLITAYGRTIKNPTNEFREGCYDLPWLFVVAWPCALVLGAAVWSLDYCQSTSKMDRLVSYTSRRLFK